MVVDERLRKVAITRTTRRVRLRRGESRSFERNANCLAIRRVSFVRSKGVRSRVALPGQRGTKIETIDEVRGASECRERLERTTRFEMTSRSFDKYVLIGFSTFAFLFYVAIFRSPEYRAVSRVRGTTKKILFWNTMFGDETFYMGKGDIFRGCPVNDCYATRNRSYANPLDFDAVLFHGNEIDLEDLPSERSPRQRYVFANLESPANRRLTNRFLETYFDTTMTYRLDSDVPWTFGSVLDASTDRIVAPLRNTEWTKIYEDSGNREEDRANPEPSGTIRAKTKPIAWFVSNCFSMSGREKYVFELSKYIRVDIYGKCGRYSCPRNRDCFNDVAEPNYFFYLSFENSLCEDYVTEKLYNALRYNVVPIVYGGANYTSFAPPRSYIDALEFDSPKDLAEHLKRLIENPHQYQKHLDWKNYYKIDGSNHRVACKLCEFLHENRKPRRFDLLSDWYSWYSCPLQSILSREKYATRTSVAAARTRDRDARRN